MNDEINGPAKKKSKASYDFDSDNDDAIAALEGVEKEGKCLKIFKNCTFNIGK